MSLAAGDYLVVFASSKDRTNPASELHTNFKLSSDGEYLALVEPGGTQVAFAFDPIYPAQQEDISYGFAGDSAAVILLEEVQPCLTLVPSDGSLGTNWVARTFDDGSWAEGMTGMGYERSSGYQGLIGSDLNAQMYNIRSTAYMRVPVVVGNPEDVAELELKIKFDDGFIAYINGQPVASSAAPATPVWDSEAIFRRPSDDMALSFTPFAISIRKTCSLFPLIRPMPLRFRLRERLRTRPWRRRDPRSI